MQCYREDIETSLRTPGFGGFQLLDLQDFPGQGTALVGALFGMVVVALAVRAGWHYVLAQMLATGLALLLTYFINRRWTFGR